MKIEESDGTITKGNIRGARTVKSGISQDVVKHIARLLTRLYNDPESAVFREYVANALDAHTAAGNDEPINIFLPTKETQILTIMDRGTGMSALTMEAVYSQYGESTKASSNNEIGGYGLGSKSALAIASQFTIISCKDGIRTHAIYANSADGQPELDIISEEPTDEPNGTSITIPIPNPQSLVNKAIGFMRYLPVGSFTVDGYKHNYHHTEMFKDNLLTEDTLEFVDKVTREVSNVHLKTYQSGWNGNVNIERGVVLVMGGIKYEIPELDIRSNLDEDPEVEAVVNELFQTLVVIDAPIGSVKLSPSREGIQFTKETREFFNKVFRTTAIQFRESLCKRITEAETYVEAAYNFKGLIPERRKLVPNSWNGIPLKESASLFFAGSKITVNYSKYEGRANSSKVSSLGLKAFDDDLIIVTGVKTQKSFMSYASPYLKSVGVEKTVLYIEEEVLLGLSRSGMANEALDKNGNSVPNPISLSSSELDVIFPEGLKVIDFEEYRLVANAWRKENKPKVSKATKALLGRHYYTISEDMTEIKAVYAGNLEVSDLETVYFMENWTKPDSDTYSLFGGSRDLPTGLSEVLVEMYGKDSLIVFLDSNQTAKGLLRVMKLLDGPTEAVEVDHQKIIKKILRKPKSSDKDVLAYVVVSNCDGLKSIANAKVSKDLTDPILRKAIDNERIARVKADIDLLSRVPEGADVLNVRKAVQRLHLEANNRYFGWYSLEEQELVATASSSFYAKYPLLRSLRTSGIQDASKDHLTKYLNSIHRSDKTPVFTLELKSGTIV